MKIVSISNKFSQLTESMISLLSIINAGPIDMYRAHIPVTSAIWRIVGIFLVGANV